jgi:hypothetical protein
VGKFTAVVVDTVGKYPPVSLTCEYLREISKKFEMTLILFSGAWVKMIYDEKT